MAADLKTCLRDVLPVEELDLLVRSYDMIGDIAVIIIPEELVHRQRLIGEAILGTNRRIRVVAKRVGNYGGEFRTIDLEVIAGENRKETEHREYGVRLLVNPEEVYFSVRSSTERHRIASLVQPGEEVLVLFSGIGPYPLVIAAGSRAKRIVGIEKNPAAHRYAQRNLRRNKRLNNVELLQGDVEELLPTLGSLFDRVVMPLPVGGARFLAPALDVLRPGGWLHYYEMLPDHAFEDAVDTVREACRTRGRLLRQAAVVKCGHCSPRAYRVCADSLVE